MTDGPPLWLAAALFVLVAGAWLGPGSPALALAVFAVVLVATVALEFRATLADHGRARDEAAATWTTLRQRLDAARARQVERDRWR